jgi:hypothetical protein
MKNKPKCFLPYILLTLIALISAATLSILSGASAELVQSNEEQTTAIIEPTVESRLVARHTVEYVEKPVTEVKYVERVTSVPVECRNFYTLDELENWLALEAVSASVYLQSPGVEIDCDDYAFELQRKALADGFIISFEIVSESEYNVLFRQPLPTGATLHAINLAIIDNSIYYIEPQTAEVVFVANLD